jgi:hypothetical protein
MSYEFRGYATESKDSLDVGSIRNEESYIDLK